MFSTRLIYLPWIVSLGSFVGSLYFSEIQHFAPCILCWYQRICMYPLMVIFAVGIIKKDKNLPWYVYPFSVSGFFIALFHNLLYYNIIPESAAPCVVGISCTTKFIEWFGFVTIPLLSLISFALITISMLFLQRNFKKI